jgi:hypothetical protein
MAVIPFRARNTTPNGERSARTVSELRPPVMDLARFERATGTEDYRHRMLVNLLAFAVTALLVLAGVWLATTMATLQARQDCALMGRTNCAPLQGPTVGR